MALLPDPSPRERQHILISVDDHVIEPPDMFDGRLPKALADRAPRIVETDDGRQVWRYEDREYPNIRLNAVIGRPKEEWSMEAARFDEMRRGCWDIDARIADMDLAGIWASLNFPSLIAEQVDKMAALLGAALADGALGLSTSQSNTHNDGEGQPVPSRSASREELLALASAVRAHPGAQIEAIIPGCLSGFTDDDIVLLTDMSRAADWPLNWNVLGVSAGNPEGHEKQLRASEVAAERGGRVVALTLPHSTKIRLSFLSGFVLDGLPGWRETMHLPVPERMRALADPEVRRRLNEGAHSEEAGILRGLANWERLILVETFAPENADELRTCYDLPSGAPRLVADACGISSVMVGGVEVCHDGAATGAMPGTILRSGRDTETVTAS